MEDEERRRRRRERNKVSSSILLYSSCASMDVLTGGPVCETSHLPYISSDYL